MEILGTLAAVALVFVALVALLGALPRLLSRTMDPPRIKFILDAFVSAGCAEVHVKPFSAHYGVRYVYAGSSHYTKCLPNLRSRTLKWVGSPPPWADPPNSSLKRTDQSLRD